MSIELTELQEIILKHINDNPKTINGDIPIEPDVFKGYSLEDMAAACVELEQQGSLVVDHSTSTLLIVSTRDDDRVLMVNKASWTIFDSDGDRSRVLKVGGEVHR